MERRGPLDSLPRFWLSGAILDFDGHGPYELGFCLALWSPSDSLFSARLCLFLPPDWQVSDSDRTLPDDLFAKFSGAT
jgi:hypothetical protein